MWPQSGAVRRKTKRKKSTKTKDEHIHQRALVSWFKAEYRPYERLLICIPNGAQNWGPKKGNIMQLMGLQPDVPDLFLLITRSDYAGLWIEVKKPDGKLTKSQKEYHWILYKQGFAVDTCFGWANGGDIINNYLKGNYEPPEYIKAKFEEEI